MITTGNYFANMTLPLALLHRRQPQPQALRGGAMLTGWATVNRLCCIPVLLVLGAWALGFSLQALGIRSSSAPPPPPPPAVMTRAMGGDSALAANIIATTTARFASGDHQHRGGADGDYLGLMGWPSARLLTPFLLHTHLLVGGKKGR